jgi:hypothetical protein
MAGSPVKRQRQAERERAASGVRAGASDPATRRWAVERAEQIGDERAAKEACVSRATLRSWRKRLKDEAGSVASEGASGGGPAMVASSVRAVVAGDGELEQTEAELGEVREARAVALARSVELGRAGNDIASSNASRAAKEFAAAARSLAAEAVLLRESDVRLTERQGELLARALEDFTRRLALPWVASVRELLSAALQLAAGREVPDIDRTAGRAADELRKHFAALLAAEAPALGRNAEDLRHLDTPEAAPHGRVDAPKDSATGSFGDPLGAEPGGVNGGVVDVPAGQIETAVSISEDAEIAEGDLIALAEIPAAWRSRFVFGADGDARARAAWTRKVRADEAARAVAAEVAAEAEAEQARAAAAERAARVPGPAPAGWDSRRGGRGRGPAGERAGP